MWEVAFKSFASPVYVYSTIAFYDNGLASANNEYKESLGTCHCNKSRLTPLGLNKCKGGANLFTNTADGEDERRSLAKSKPLIGPSL